MPIGSNLGPTGDVPPQASLCPWLKIAPLERKENDKKKMKTMNVVQYARGDQGVEKAKRRNVKKTAKR